MTISTLPVIGIDVIGSILMIVLSVLCLKLSLQLRNRDRNNVIWAYLTWVCYALTLFAVSRSVGHILKQILLIVGHPELWQPLRPVSGALNSISFMLVAAVTLFFQRTWRIYREISNDKQALRSTRDELIYMNQNLEKLVAERTDRLTQSERKYRSIFENSKDIILVTDPAGTILDINPVGYQTLGWDDHNEPLIGRPLHSFFSRGDQWHAILQRIVLEASIANAEAELKRTDGSLFAALITGSLTLGDSDTENIVHLLIKDIEKRRLMEKHMARTDKLASIGEFSAGIAHEINNPLGIILGYTQLLLRDEPEATERHQDLKTIEKHARNCKTIVADLLNFSRTSSPVRNSIDLHPLIDEVVAFIQQHARTDTMVVEKRYDPKLPRLVIDDKKMRQVLINLIMNAKHAIADQGTIRISTRGDTHGGMAAIRISDDGYGIDKQNLTRIFDPFFTTKPMGEGTGLGLSVSYGIVKNHGGDIRVASQPGQGTTFTVELPLHPETGEANHEAIHSSG